MAWGGKDHKDLPHWSLSAADFVQCKAEAFDKCFAPSEHKLEARPRHPAVFSTWKRQAENGIRIFECVYGLEHGAERRKALAALQEAHESDDEAFPAAYTFARWEELQGAWCEQLREGRRNLLRTLATDNPRKEDLKILALAPGPDGAAAWKFPNVFDLDDPQ